MKKLLLVFVLLTCLSLPLTALAQSDEEPVVRAILFYSPTCPHCHQVINEVLLPMIETHGDQLQVMGVDTSQPGGAQLYQAAVKHYQLSEDRLGVPTLIVSDVVLVGSGEIPDQFPGIVQEGLEADGIDWPDIPGLADVIAQAEQTPTPASPPTLTPAPPEDTAAPEEPTREAAVCRPDEEECDDVELPSLEEVSGASTLPDEMVPLTDDRIVRLLFIWREDCTHCHEVMEEVLPPIQEKYGDQLEITFLETTEPDRYKVYLSAVDLYNVPPKRQGWPAVFIGDTHLISAAEISERLEDLIDRYLAQGGVGYAPIEGLDAVTGQAAGSGSSGSGPGAGEAEPIYMAYFYQTGCQDCDRVKGDLEYLKSEYPQLVVEEFNVRQETELAEWLGQRAGVPEKHRLTAPTVFVGDDYLLEEDLDARSLAALLDTYAPEGAEKVWENWEEKAGETAKKSIVERFKSLGVFTIVLAGLIDGLNPCAFATLVFFVSYLTISGRKGREVLLVGAAFTLGVFVAYVAVGFGFSRVLDMFNDTLTTLGRWVYGLTAAFCLVLAVFSFLDYLKARRGEIGDMSLNLPHGLRMRINATIRKTRNSQAFVATAFVTGIVVSFLELACTGQVYLPTIVYVMSEPNLKAQAFLFLLLYNLLFVAPLIVVFALAYYGTGAKQFSEFLQRRASTVKLGMSFLFLALGGWLVVALA